MNKFIKKLARFDGIKYLSSAIKKKASIKNFDSLNLFDRIDNTIDNLKLNKKLEDFSPDEYFSFIVANLLFDLAGRIECYNLGLFDVEQALQEAKEPVKFIWAAQDYQKIEMKDIDRALELVEKIKALPNAEVYNNFAEDRSQENGNKFLDNLRKRIELINQVIEIGSSTTIDLSKFDAIRSEQNFEYVHARDEEWGMAPLEEFEILPSGRSVDTLNTLENRSRKIDA